jgi:glycosyltransferase involved in cell wall biosynthesis
VCNRRKKIPRVVLFNYQIGVVMKILIVSVVGEPEHTRSIPMALAKHDGIDVTVIAPSRVASGELSYDPSRWLCIEREENAGNYHLIPVPLKNPSNFDYGFEIGALVRAIKNVNPDVIQVWGRPTSKWLFRVELLKLRGRLKSKVVFYGFDNLPIIFGSRLSRLKWKLTWGQVAGGLEADSEGVRNVREAGIKGPVERVFWGISTDIFKPLNKIVLKQQLKIEYEHIIGYVGRFVPEKGLAVLLAAMRRLPANVHCLMVGHGPMRADLDLWSSLPDLKGRVHLLDPVPPEWLVKYMNCMDVLALPSLTIPQWKEQYGRVIGEAMACGIPVVGSDSGAIPEVIGAAGLTSPEGNIDALAQALQIAIFDENVRGSLIQKGLLRAEQELSIKAMSKRLLDFYARILGK